MILLLSDVTGLQFSGFRQVRPETFGLRVGPGFFASGFGQAFGPKKNQKMAKISSAETTKRVLISVDEMYVIETNVNGVHFSSSNLPQKRN